MIAPAIGTAGCWPTSTAKAEIRPGGTGWPVAVHAIGDAANRAAVDKLAAAQHEATRGGGDKYNARHQAAGKPPPRERVELDRYRPPRRAVERVGPRPDRLAMWALLMGLVLILVAVAYLLFKFVIGLFVGLVWILVAIVAVFGVIWAMRVL